MGVESGVWRKWEDGTGGIPRKWFKVDRPRSLNLSAIRRATLLVYK